MNRFNRLVCVLAALLLAAAAHAQGGAPAKAPPQGFTTTAKPTENDPVSAQREHELALQLRCLVCQNQSIAESNADLAVDLRRQVREQIAAGRSDSPAVVPVATRNPEGAYGPTGASAGGRMRTRPTSSPRPAG